MTASADRRASERRKEEKKREREREKKKRENIYMCVRMSERASEAFERLELQTH